MAIYNVGKSVRRLGSNEDIFPMAAEEMGVDDACSGQLSLRGWEEHDLYTDLFLTLQFINIFPSTGIEGQNE